MTDPVRQGEKLSVLRALGPGQIRKAETSVPALHEDTTPTLSSAELPHGRQSCLVQHLPNVPNTFLLHLCGCQVFKDNVQLIQCSPCCRFMAPGVRDDNQLVNLTESSRAVISPGSFLGRINAKEKELCWKM